MRYQRARENRFLAIVLTLTGILFLITGGSSSMFAILQPIQTLQQSQIMTCTGSVDSCQTVTCIDNEPCHTFRSNSDPFAYEQPQNDVTVMQPLENTATVMQPEEDTLMQPSEGTAGTTMAPEDDMEVIEGVMDDQ